MNAGGSQLCATWPGSHRQRAQQRLEQCLVTVMFVSKEIDPACQQLIIDHHRWIGSFTRDVSCRALPCIFSDILSQVGTRTGRVGENENFVSKRRRLSQGEMQWFQPCSVHGVLCSTQTQVQIEVSGLPCPDNSRANVKRQFEEGRSGAVYIAWSRVHIAKRTPLLILENVPVPRC